MVEHGFRNMGVGNVIENFNNSVFKLGERRTGQHSTSVSAVLIIQMTSSFIFYWNAMECLQMMSHHSWCYFKNNFKDENNRYFTFFWSWFSFFMLHLQNIYHYLIRRKKTRHKIRSTSYINHLLILLAPIYVKHFYTFSLLNHYCGIHKKIFYLSLFLLQQCHYTHYTSEKARITALLIATQLPFPLVLMPIKKSYIKLTLLCLVRVANP